MARDDKQYSIDGSPVVRSNPGAVAGETRYETADGRCWRDASVQCSTDSDTGVTYAKLRRRY